MDVYRNGDPLSGFVPSPAATLGQVLEALDLWLEAGEVIFAIEVDGEAFAAGDPALAGARPVTSISRLHIRTMPTEAVVTRLEEDARAAFEIIAAKLRRVRQGRAQPDPARERLLAEAMVELKLALELDQGILALGGRACGPTLGELEGPMTAALHAREAGRGDEAGRALGALEEILSRSTQDSARAS